MLPVFSSFAMAENVLIIKKNLKIRRVQESAAYVDELQKESQPKLTENPGLKIRYNKNYVSRYTSVSNHK